MGGGLLGGIALRPDDRRAGGKRRRNPRGYAAGPTQFGSAGVEVESDNGGVSVQIWPKFPGKIFAAGVGSDEIGVLLEFFFNSAA